MVPDTIVAESSPHGCGGVSLLRISGSQVPDMARALLGSLPAHRHAHYGRLLRADGGTLDEVMATYFAAPNSYTGEPVLELYVHGNPLIVQSAITRVCELGARLAEPGEFTLRRFLNQKIDLIEAEAVADLIAGDSERAIQAALRSLKGDFSDRVESLRASLVDIRKWVEAAVDFSDEDIDLLPIDHIRQKLGDLCGHLDDTLTKTRHGALITEGAKVAIVGPSNAGKSSLRNYLANNDDAIVTDVPGTTRDAIQATLNFHGMRITLVDTAGFRSTADPVENIGIERSRRHASEADLVIWVQDVSADPIHAWRERWTSCWDVSPESVKHIRVFNQVDRCASPPRLDGEDEGESSVVISLKTGEGIGKLEAVLKLALQWEAQQHEGLYSARRRHVEALMDVQAYLNEANTGLQPQDGCDWLLMAESLRLAQHALNRITGRYTSDDLLGEIFSDFCIGK